MFSLKEILVFPISLEFILAMRYSRNHVSRIALNNICSEKRYKREEKIKGSPD
jgi:hypothetical protein